MIIPIIGAVAEITSSSLVAAIGKAVIPKTAPVVWKGIWYTGAFFTSLAVGRIVNNAITEELGEFKKLHEERKSLYSEETVVTADDQGNLVTEEK